MSGDPRPPLELPVPAPLTPPADLAARLAENGIELDPAVLAKQGDYLARLLAMNEQVNLTAITDPAEAWEKHIFDALTLVPLLGELEEGAKVVDIGSGGGVPAIPLALARPDLSFTLVEATQKKATFLAQVAAALGLDNVKVRAERAEKLAAKELRGRFDCVTARAVGRLAMLLEITLPFVKPDGMALLIKGQKADEELAEAARVLKKLHAEHEVTVDTPTGRIVVLRKID